MADWYRISNVDEIPSPTILLYPERIEHNLQRMITMAGGAERLRPHVKTHKLPQIIAMKRAAGIHKFKVSTIAEAEMTATATRLMAARLRASSTSVENFVCGNMRISVTRRRALGPTGW